MAAMQPSGTHANSNDRSVVVLKTSDITIRGNEVFMPILIEMSQIKKPEREQFKKVEITKEMTERDVTEKLLETFPYLRNQRFYCAAAADGRTRLDFNGDRRIWNGRLIKRLLKGNSALYIFVDEQVPGYANMAPQPEASSRTAVATATQNRVDLDATLVSSSHSLPMGSSGHKETQPAQGPFCASSVCYSPNTLQDSSSPEQLTTKRPPEQMTTAENEMSNQTFKKLRATKGVSYNTEKNVAGDLTAGTPLRALGTATMQGKVSEIPSRSHQTQEQLRNLSCRNADMKESTDVTGQFDPLSFVCHPNLTIQDAKNTTVAIPSHSHPITTSGNVTVKYPAPQMNSSWTSENDIYVPLQQCISWNSPLSNLSNDSPNVNTQAIQPMETDGHGFNQDLNSSASGRRWASSDKIAVSPQGPILNDLLESSNLCWRENDSSDSEIDFSNLIALSEMDDSELASLLSPSGVDSSLTAQASNNVGLHSQNQRHNTIQMPGPLDAMQTQVSHVMRGNNSDSGLGSQSSSSAPQSRHTSDMENSALEEYPAIIKIRPNAVGLSGAPSCEFLGLAELFPEVQSGYATVGNLEKEILWKKGDKHGNGNCIPPSTKPGKQIVKIYSVTGRKLVEAELWYVDPCHLTDDECLVRVGEKAPQSYEELFRVMSNILIRFRPQASIKSGESQYSGNSESSLIVQVLRFLINEAAESGLQWDSLPLLEFVAMNHDNENAALFLEEIIERYARDTTPEGRERIDLSEWLAAINASHEEDEASDTSDGRNDSDSSYDGDVESLLCDSEEPTSDSEDDHSDMLRKGNEIQMGGNNAEMDERVILNLPSGYLSGPQIGEKETQPTHSRLKDSTVSVKESVITERVSDQPSPTSSDSMLPFGKNGKFSRKAIAIKQREKDSKLLQGEYRISRIREHFNCEFPNLTSMRSVREPIICFLLTTESINRCLSTMEDRWRIQLQRQRLPGRMTMSPLSLLFQAMHIKPEEALKSLSTDADLSSPSDNTFRTRFKPFDSPLPSNDSTPSDVVTLTSTYHPSGKILLSFVSDRNGFLPPESRFEDEDCELLMECWKWRRCKNNLLALKVVEIKDQPASSGIRAQGRLATGVYKRPLWEEKGLVKRLPENFIRRNWTGKTSLKKSLVWRTNKSRENTEPEPEFLFEEQTSQLIYKRRLKKVKSHSSYAEDLSWNPICSSTVPLKVIEKAKELSKPTDMSLQNCKQVEKAKDDSQEPSTKGMDPSLKLRLPKQLEDINDYLMSPVYPPVIVNTNHQKTLSCAHADNPYHNGKPRHLVESSNGTLKDNAYSKRLKDSLVVDNEKSERSEYVANTAYLRARLRLTIKDLKKPQPMMGDVAELKSVIGEKQQDKTKPDNNEERCTFSKEVALSMAGESRSLQENLSQKESLEGSLPYVEQIRKAECEKRDIRELLKLLKRRERVMTYDQGQLPNRVSKERKQFQEQLIEYKSPLRDRETRLENGETQLRELQEQFTILEERRERETYNLQDELEIKRQEFDKVERELRDREQDTVRLNRELLDTETRLENVETQLRDLLDRETRLETQLRDLLQEQFTTLKERRERETCNLQDELKIKREKRDELERELRDRVQDLKSDLKKANETKSKYELSVISLDVARAVEYLHQRKPTHDWILSRDEVELTDKCLGEGAFGIVLEGRYCDCPIAVKRLKEFILTPQAYSLFEREMDIASRIRHSCLLLFIGATEDESSRSLFIVTELMDSSLRALLGKTQLSETEVSVISLDVARALEYLHQRKPTPIIHRDVSCTNVLLWKQNDQWRGKLSDYGTAKFVAEIMTKNPGAVIYTAPQTKIDVYSFGALLTEMCLKKELPDPERREEQARRVQNKRGDWTHNLVVH